MSGPQETGNKKFRDKQAWSFCCLGLQTSSALLDLVTAVYAIIMV